MENLQPNPEDVFKHKMEGFSQEPDPEMWDRIEGRLPRPTSHLWAILTPWAILLFLTGAGLGGYFGSAFYSVPDRDNQSVVTAYNNSMDRKLGEMENELLNQRNQNEKWMNYALEKESETKRWM